MSMKHHLLVICVVHVKQQIEHFKKLLHSLITRDTIDFLFLSTHLTKTLRAPSGVTSMAGAKAYAVKFAISPTITMKTIHCVLV